MTERLTRRPNSRFDSQIGAFIYDQVNAADSFYYRDFYTMLVKGPFRPTKEDIELYAFSPYDLTYLNKINGAIQIEDWLQNIVTLPYMDWEECKFHFGLLKGATVK